MNAREERSAGVILYRLRGRKPVFLLLQYPALHWEFAKGKKEGRETDLQTALREVREETGIVDVEIVPGFRERMKYRYMDGDTIVHKEVVFFLGKTATKRVVLSDEHRRHAWEGYENAASRVTYPAAKSMLARARRHIQN